MTEPVLEIAGVHKKLGGRPILSGVGLSISEGQLVGLVGPNGAGKTTLIRIVAGLLKADAGTVRLGGKSLDGARLDRRARQGLGYLAQDPTVFRKLTVWENLRSVPGVSAEACESVAAEVGMDGLLGSLGGDLSGGERRRLEVARLLLTGPRIVVCDEPFAALDPVGVQTLARLLKRAVASEGSVQAVLLTDHRVESVFGLCDEVAVLLDGQIAAQGTPTALRSNPVIRARYLGEGGV